MTQKSLFGILLVTFALAFYQADATLRASGTTDSRSTFEELRETGMTQAEEIRENSDIEEIEENLETTAEELSENRSIRRSEVSTVYWSLLRQRARGVEFEEKQEIEPYDAKTLARLNRELVERIDRVLAARDKDSRLHAALSDAKHTIEGLSHSREALEKADLAALRSRLDAILEEKRAAKDRDPETFNVLHETYVELLRLHHLVKS